jgi:TniQ
MSSHEQEPVVQALHLLDPTWMSTLPHRVAPHPDEWLPGLLLRCDEANHWDSGTTLAHLLRSIRKTLLRGKTNWIVVPTSAVECLAQLLEISTKTLLATTYQVELARLYGTSTPHARQLSTAFSFRLCSACLAERRLLRCTWVLPHITLCPLHHVTLANTCQCGSQVHLFSPQTRPFTCPRCGMDWVTLPHEPAPASRIALEQTVLSCYAFFFAEGTPLLLSRALQLVRMDLKQRKASRVKRLDGSIKSVEHYELTKASLGYLVDLLVSLDLSPQKID